MRSEETIARAHCANYSLGKCLGIMLATNPKEGYSTSVKQWVNTEQEGKDCGKIVNECCYFQHIVIPGVQNNI